ncbi:MAG: YeeE/YedE family protein [Erythrobacter sp.]|jgi:uncharacterized membrane protein YedE/YeeE|nr:YeeE/YedE family protein [Erythrobacter sp.]
MATAAPPQRLPRSLFVAALALSALLATVWSVSGARLFLACLIGVVAGLALYHAAFGFTVHWRQFINEGRGAGLRSQFILIGLTSLVTFPLIGLADTLGIAARGAVAPVGLSLIAGAFLFGFGMMFAGGCGSGTLFTVGGGSTRMAVTLGAFVTGSLFATLHVGWWHGLPSLGRFGLIDRFGSLAAFGIVCTFMAAIWLYSAARERRLHGRLEAPRQTGTWLTGPWSLLAGAVALAAVGIATLMLLGRPWGITSAFALWGAKLAIAVGVDAASWPYWQSRTGWLERSVFEDPTSVMNFGIIGGALLAANLAGRFRPTVRLTLAELGTALLGGLCMGYGARIGYGCNIGAYLGGTISGSLHGLAWMMAALAGSALALKLRTGRGFVP